MFEYAKGFFQAMGKFVLEYSLLFVLVTAVVLIVNKLVYWVIFGV
jgi:hypothetical protein